MKPSPQAALRKPKCLARSADRLTSATQAFAVAKVALAAAEMKRPTKSQVREGAIAITT